MKKHYYVVQDGELENLESTSEFGPRVHIEEKKERHLRISLQEPVPELNLPVGAKQWYTTDEVFIVNGDSVIPFTDKKLDAY